MARIPGAPIPQFSALALLLACSPEPPAADSEPGTGDTADDTDDDPPPIPTTEPGEGSLYCVDADHDGFGSSSNCVEVPAGAEPPPGAVPNADDCNDDAPNTFPGAAYKDDPVACMKDRDDDDFGDIDPPGEAGPGDPQPGTDCDDEAPNTFPGAAPNDDVTACMKDAADDDWGDAHPPAPVVPGTDCDDSNFDVHLRGMCVDVDGDGWFGEALRT